jgi:aspartate racemase
VLWDGTGQIGYDPPLVESLPGRKHVNNERMNDGDLTAGVLGGMGPEATVDFMSLVIALTGASRDQDHIHLLVDQNPQVPNRQRAIRGEGPDPGPELGAMARRLERAGADFLVMPCNTAHVFAKAIQDAVRIPLVSIIDVTVEEIGKLRPEARRVGVMATDGMLQTGLLQRAMAKAGLESVLPTDSELRQLMQLIHAIKAGDKGGESRHSMAALANALARKGAELVVAACTEIPLVLSSADLSVPLLSTTEVLARRTVAIARRKVSLPTVV